jgi:hypothetical protein
MPLDISVAERAAPHNLRYPQKFSGGKIHQETTACLALLCPTRTRIGETIQVPISTSTNSIGRPRSPATWLTPKP